MKFSILEAVVQDFKSWRGKHVFDFSWAGPGCHRIKGINDDNSRLGSNGSGKSTFFSDALTWCLFGRTSRNLKNPDVRPWSGKGKTAVRFLIEVGGVKCWIQRTINPNQLTMGAKAAGQADVERFLGMSFDVFTHTILLAQGQDLFFDKSPREKMQLFSDVLQLERWDDRAALAADRARAQQQLLERALGGQQQATTLFEIAVKDSKRARASYYEWDQKRVEMYEGALLVVASIEKKLNRLQLEHGEQDLARDSAGMQLNMIITDLRNAEQEQRVALSVYNDAELKVKNHRYAVLDMKKRLEDISWGNKCPTCGQPVKGSLTKHRAELRAKIKAREKLCKFPDGVLEAVDVIDAKVNRLRTAKLEFEDKERAARDNMEQLNSRIQGLRADVTIAKARADEHNKSINPHKEAWDRAKQQLVQLRDVLAEAKDIIGIVERRIARAKFWMKGFKDMRLYLVEDVLQELTIASNAALEEVGLIGWSIEFVIERDTKKGTAQQGIFVFIKSPANKKPVRWEAWSGGEGQRLRLIGALALAEVLLSHAGLEPKIEILDEPTRHMSIEGVRDVVEYLILRAKDTGRQLFYVDHQAVDSKAFASTVIIAKDGRGSYIVGDDQ